MKEIILEVKSSYGRALGNRQFIERFYDIFTKSHPDILGKFENTDFSKQHKLLDQAISLAMLYPQGNVIAKQVFTKLRESHNRRNLNIQPKYIQYWEKSLLQTVSESDPEFTPELAEKWHQVLKPAMDYIKEGY